MKTDDTVLKIHASFHDCCDFVHQQCGQRRFRWFKGTEQNLKVQSDTDCFGFSL